MNFRPAAVFYLHYSGDYGIISKTMHISESRIEYDRTNHRSNPGRI